jgi:hypothetical protein
MTEIEKMREKGNDWTANDLFKFQYGIGYPTSTNVDERKEICYEWINRLQQTPKKYCYLAWYSICL